MNEVNATHIEELRAFAGQKHGIAVFIGAGCSAVLNIPLWKEMLATLNEEFRCYKNKDEVYNALNQIGPYEVASKLKQKALEAGNETTYKKVISRQTKATSCHFTSLHLEIVSLTKTIVTTNYDSSFEEALLALQRLSKRFDASDNFDATFSKRLVGNLKPLGLGTERTLYKIHGDSDTGDIVLTYESYTQQYENPGSGVATLINTLFSSLNTLFIGFSFDDAMFVSFLKKALEQIAEDRREYGYELPEHFCIISDKFSGEDFSSVILEAEDFDVPLLKASGILEEVVLDSGEHRFKFTPGAKAIIEGADLGPSKNNFLFSLLKDVNERQAKANLLKQLNIKPIYFTGSNYLEIEHILRELNKPQLAPSKRFTLS